MIFHRNIFYQKNGIFSKLSSRFQLKNTAMISLTTVKTKKWLCEGSKSEVILQKSNLKLWRFFFRELGKRGGKAFETVLGKIKGHFWTRP